MIFKWYVWLIIGVVGGVFIGAKLFTPGPRYVPGPERVVTDTLVVRDTLRVTQTVTKTRVDTFEVIIPAGTYNKPVKIRYGSRDTYSGEYSTDHASTVERARVDSIRGSASAAGVSLPVTSPRWQLGLGAEYKFGGSEVNPYAGLWYRFGDMPLIGGPVHLGGRYGLDRTITLSAEWRIGIGLGQ